MSRTYKDGPVAKKRRPRNLPFSRSYLRTMNPRRRDFEIEESDCTACPMCDSELNFVNGVPFCDSCGWGTVESLIDEMDIDDAA